MIRHVAFDFDGTLVRSNRIKRECFYETLADVPGASAVLDELFASRFSGDRFALFDEVVRRLGGTGTGSALAADALAAAYGKLCRARIAAAPEVPGAAATLDRLASAGMTLYLISATPQQALDKVVSDRRLTRFFEHVLGAPTSKTAHLRGVMMRHRISSMDLAMVGDGLDDKIAAEEIGCKFIAVTDEPNAPLEGVEIRIPDLWGLPGLLGLTGAAAAISAEGPKP